MRRGFVQRVPVAVLLVLLLACDPGPQDSPGERAGVGRPRAGPLLVVGVDGLEWDVLLGLLSQERLPNLRALMEEGTFGLLRTLKPTSSPVIWTSVATGKSPERHGIRGFIRERAGGHQELYTSADRTTKAIWNIVSDYGRTVCTIGWWMTYPVEPINGTMVSQTNTIPKGGHVRKGRLIPGVPDQVHPPERQATVMAVLEESDARIGEISRQIFGSFPHPLGRYEEVFWTKTQWVFRADATYLRIAVELLRGEESCELTLFYIGGTDVVGHYFWRYYQPHVFPSPPPPEQIENLGEVINDYYAFADHAIGELLGAAPPDTTIFVISDHGMVPVVNPPNVLIAVAGLTGHHKKAPPGVLIAAGPTIRRRSPDTSLSTLERADLPVVGSVLDVTPTLLALMRIPLGRDMEGEVLTELVTPEFEILDQPPPVPSHDTAEFLKSRRRPRPDLRAEQERLEQLRGLGYIGGEEMHDDASTAPSTAPAPADSTTAQ